MITSIDLFLWKKFKVKVKNKIQFISKEMNRLSILNLLILKKSKLKLQYSFYSLSSNKNRIRLTLYTKPECSLCDKAKDDLIETYGDLFELEEVNILKSRDLFRKFKLDIPVFYFNGEILMQHKIDKLKLDDLIKKIK